MSRYYKNSGIYSFCFKMSGILIKLEENEYGKPSMGKSHIVSERITV